jgi:hypothetical protein
LLRFADSARSVVGNKIETKKVNVPHMEICS